MDLSNLMLGRHRVLKRTDNYIYIAPHPLISLYIAHYTLSFPNPYKTVKIETEEDLMLIPDASGCLIYTWGESGLTSSLWGPTTEIVTVNNDIDTTIRFFIEFMPGGVHVLTGIPQGEMVNLKLALDDIDKKLENTLLHTIENNAILGQMIEAIDHFFLRIIEQRKISPYVQQTLAYIAAGSPCISIKELAINQVISERHLNRVFKEQIGISPKMFMRFNRINKALTLLKYTHSPNISFVAQELGYFDQAHFIKDFKSVCHVTPTSFIKNKSDFYNEDFKY